MAAKTDQAPVAAESGQPGLHFKDIKFVGHHKGERQWELEAQVVDVVKDQDVVEFRQIRSGTVFRDGGPYMKFLASSGRYYAKEDNFVIEGAVNLVSKDGDVFQASSLQWNPQTRQVTSLGAVDAKVKGLWFRADRFAVDVSGEWLLASGNVQVVKDNGDSFLCEDLIYSFKDDSWQMQGQVDLTIEL
jgi:LPS export ABC transporter protein LptC